MFSHPEPQSEVFCRTTTVPATTESPKAAKSASHCSPSSSTEVNPRSTPSPAAGSPVDCFYCDESQYRPVRGGHRLRRRPHPTTIEPLLRQPYQRGGLASKHEKDHEARAGEGGDSGSLSQAKHLSYDTIDNLSCSHSPSPGGGLICSGVNDGQDRFFKPRPLSNSTSNHYRDNSANSCMTETVRKVIDEGQESPATHAVSPQDAQSNNSWPSAWRGLLRFQAFIVFLLLLAALIGSTFAGIKWSYVSPKLHGVSIPSIHRAIQASNASRPDYQFAKRVLFTPIPSLTETDWQAPGDDVYPMSEDLSVAPFSVFIPSTEKRQFRKHRQENVTYPPNFSVALICSELSQDIEHANYDWSYSAFTSPKLHTFNSEVAQLFHPITPFQNPTSSHMAKVDSNIFGLGRRCVLWSDGRSTLRRGDMPRIIKGTGGIFSPNYPGEAWIHGILKNPLWMALIILFAWSHSLFTEQSWTGVHLPRLAFYAVVGLYRWLVLYLGLGEIEKFHQIQGIMRSADAALKISQTFSRNPSDFFDFSDHMVATFTCLFVLATELFCLLEFSFRSQGIASSVSSIESVDAPPPASITNASGQFERPWKLPRVLLGCWIGVVFTIICALIYGGFATAAFFHSPLETLTGCLIGFVGIWGVFWLLLFFDSGIHSIWFWRN